MTFASRAERTAYRRKYRLCVHCGIALDPDEKAKCDVCKVAAAKRQKRYRAKHPDNSWLKADRNKHPEKYKRARLKVYEDHKVSKICTKCSDDALDDSDLCAKHTKRSRRYSLRWYRRVGRQRRQQRRAA